MTRTRVRYEHGEVVDYRLLPPHPPEPLPPDDELVLRGLCSRAFDARVRPAVLGEHVALIVEWWEHRHERRLERRVLSRRAVQLVLRAPETSPQTWEGEEPPIAVVRG